MTTEQKERYIQLVDETVAYYGENPAERRSGNVSTNGEMGGCYYDASNTNNKGKSDGCAIGRLLSPVQRARFDKLPETYGSISEIVSYYRGNKIPLPTALEGLGVAFMIDLQHLHDGDYWVMGGQGLNEAGKDWVAYMKDRINKGIYTSSTYVETDDSEDWDAPEDGD